MKTTSFSPDIFPGVSPMTSELLSGTEFAYSRFPTANPESLTSHVQQIQQREYPRTEIVELIRKTIATNLSPKQEENLGLLEQSSTLSVVTGQQAGVLGGPVYTALKAYGAIATASKLQHQLQQNVVPIFWVEDNDHDRDEISTATFLTPSGALLHSTLPWEQENTRHSIAHITFPYSVNEWIEQVRKDLPSTPSAEVWHSILTAQHTPKHSPSQAFVALLNELFAEQGLLFISASLVQQSGLGASLYTNIIEKQEVLQQQYEQAVQQLAQHSIVPQAKAAIPPLFYHHEGMRSRLHSGEGYFSEGLSPQTKEQLLQYINDNPSSFGTDVLSRPILQDAIIPTVCYIAGPGEISYLAELREWYEILEIPQSYPVFRPTATFLDKKTLQFTNEEDVELEMFKKGGKFIEDLLFSRHQEEGAYAIFEHSKQSLRDLFTTLQERAVKSDATLLATTDKAMNMALQQVEMVEGKVRKADKTKFEGILSKGKKAADLLFPGGKPQERSLSWLYFAMRFGKKGFLHSLQTAASDSQHSVLEVNFVE